jgi:hypothetical protein
VVVVDEVVPSLPSPAMKPKRMAPRCTLTHLQYSIVSVYGVLR